MKSVLEDMFFTPSLLPKVLLEFSYKYFYSFLKIFHLIPFSEYPILILHSLPSIS